MLSESQVEVIEALREGSQNALKNQKDPKNLYVSVKAVDVLEIIKAVDQLQGK